MDNVKNFLAIACLAYEQGDVDFSVRAFLQGMDAARANGDEGLKQVVEFFRAPVAQLVTNVPAAENTMAPALHSNEVAPIDAAKPVDPQPVVAPVGEPQPSTITSLSAAMVDEGDEELEARAEAEDEIDEDLDDEDDEEESDDESEEDDEEEGVMQLSISSSTPLRLRQV